MGKPTVYTNNHERQFLYGHQVPESILSDYSHLDESEKDDGWIHYRAAWYHVSDFMRVESHAPGWLREWDGYTNDSFFSGVVIKLASDMGTYRIGTFIG